MLVALYARVSTKRQENEETIKTQMMAIHEMAQKKGWTIIKEYTDDGWSGSNLERPALDKLRMDAETASWEAVIAYDIDRVARVHWHPELIRTELEKRGKKLLYVMTAEVKTEEQKFTQNMKSMFADYERSKITERFRLGKVRKAKEGNVVVSVPPYGYTYIRKSGSKHGYYEINEVEAEIVKMIFELVGNKGYTIRKIMKDLQRMGIKPRRSKRGVWASSTLTRLLHNKTYIGTAYFNKSQAIEPAKPFIEKKYKQVIKTSRKIRNESEWIAIKVPAIISKELFNRVQRQLKKNASHSPRNRSKNRYLLSGLIRCVCGCSRQGEGQLKGKHLYYRCTDRNKRFPLKRECSEGGINARILDEMVWDLIKKTLSSKKLISLQLERWVSRKENKVDLTKGSISALNRQLATVTKEEEKFLKAFGKGLIDQQQLGLVMGDIRDKKKDIEKQLSRLHQEKQSSDVIIPSTEVIGKFVKEVKRFINRADYQLKRDILQKCIEKVVANQGQAVVQGYLPVNRNFFYVGFKTISRNRWST